MQATDRPLPDGLIVIAKQECPTCVLVEPLLAQTDLIHDAFTERQLGHCCS